MDQFREFSENFLAVTIKPICFREMLITLKHSLFDINWSADKDIIKFKTKNTGLRLLNVPKSFFWQNLLIPHNSLKITAHILQLWRLYQYNKDNF